MSRAFEGPGNSFYIVPDDIYWVKVEPNAPGTLQSVYHGIPAQELADRYRRCTQIIEDLIKSAK